MDFIVEHALLIALVVGTGAALLWPMLGGGGGVPSVSVTEALMLMNRSKALVLDVRDAAEFAQGHIQGAKHIPLVELAARAKELEKYKDKPVLVHCQRGMRAKTACTLLRAQSFSKLHHLRGGLDAWAEANMPIVKD